MCKILAEQWLFVQHCGHTMPASDSAASMPLGHVPAALKKADADQLALLRQAVKERKR